MLAVYWPLLLIATHWPRVDLPLQPRTLHLDKLVHFSAYLVLAALVALSLPGRPLAATRRVWTTMLALLALVSAAALLDEWTQPWTGREFEWFDWLADTAGAACGLLLAARRRRGG
ncbi:MAG: VanZ family protein [Pirellulales bacterium]